MFSNYYELRAIQTDNFSCSIGRPRPPLKKDEKICNSLSAGAHPHSSASETLNIAPSSEKLSLLSGSVFISRSMALDG